MAWHVYFIERHIQVAILANQAHIMAKDVFKWQSGHICYHQKDIFKWQSGEIKRTYTVCHQKTYLTASWQIKRTYIKYRKEYLSDIVAN